ncbi:MAG: histidinol phosphate phosphatase [Nitrospinaceae bacterium]|nr:MAG: histidinol phosphate phosphatase [Nitrospinaceae bacterium]
MNLTKAKDTALTYLESAETEILKWFRKDFSVEKKADLSPVTIADRNAEEILRGKIKRDFPGHGIIGEEFGEENSTAEWVWTIDPIDGTRSFIRGLPLFASMIALLHHGEPVMGIISLPALGETSWAVKGEGAYCGKIPLKASSCKNLSKAFAATADLYCFRKKKCANLFARLSREVDIIRTYPDAFGHLMAARGAVDVMVDPLAYIWDYAPCKIMVEEAGGKFANFSGNRASIHEETAISGNPHLVQQVRKLYNESKKKKG